MPDLKPTLAYLAFLAVIVLISLLNNKQVTYICENPSGDQVECFALDDTNGPQEAGNSSEEMPEDNSATTIAERIAYNDLTQQTRMAWGTLAIVVLTGITIGLVWLTYDEARKANDIMGRMGKAQVRAYLNAKIEIDLLPKGKAIQYAISIKNDGQSPAKKVEVFCVFDVGYAQNRPAFKIGRFLGTIPASDDTRRDGTFINEDTHALFSDDFDEFTDILAGDGCIGIFFTDVFDNEIEEFIPFTWGAGTKDEESIKAGIFFFNQPEPFSEDVKKLRAMSFRYKAAKPR